MFHVEHITKKMIAIKNAQQADRGTIDNYTVFIILDGYARTGYI